MKTRSVGPTLACVVSKSKGQEVKLFLFRSITGKNRIFQNANELLRSRMPKESLP